MARTSKYSLEKEALPSAFKIWKAGLYLRLSKEDGDKEDGNKYESDSISNQRLIVEEFIVQNPDITVEEIYSDDDYSGANFNRPSFERMIEDIRLGRINCVVVKDLSRFCRNYIDGGNYLQVFFPEMDIRFIAILDNIDSFINPDSVNNCMLALKNIMNEEVCRDISIKVRSTLNAKRENGEYIGACPYGYMKAPTDKHKLIIDEEAVENVRLIFQLFMDGKSLLGITKFLNQMGVPNPSRYKGVKHRNKTNSGFWSVQTIRRILTHPMYTGDLVQFKQEKINFKTKKLRAVKEDCWIRVENTHEPIIDKGVFDSVQTMLRRDTRVSPKSNELGLFSGFLKCSDCGMALQRKFKPRTDGSVSFAYYICKTYNLYKKDICTSHRIRHDVLEKAVLSVINKYIEIAVEMDDMITQINKSPQREAAVSRIKNAIREREKERDEIDGFLLDLYPDYKRGLLNQEQYLSLKTKYEQEKSRITSVLVSLQKTSECEKNEGGVANEFLHSFLKFKNIQSLSREILMSLVDTIFVHHGGGLEIKFKFQDAFERAAEYIETNKKIIRNSATDFLQNLREHDNQVKEA